MEHLIEPYVVGQSLWILLGMVGITIFVLGKSADVMIDEAVTISVRSGLPRVIIGATIVSLGTTMPEATVSVLAAFDGKPGMALGNAVGSVICDTGLILGLACLISPLPLNRALVNRQGWVQFGAGLLLVLACIPWSNPLSVYSEGSGAALHQVTGWIFLVLLAIYMVWSVRLAKLAGGDSDLSEISDESSAEGGKQGLTMPIVRLLVGTLFLVASSAVLIASAQELAVEHFKVPIAIIAATIVAFGTSLPELVTALTAVRKNQGELAIGNVIGADILNILFVSGAAAAVTSSGLAAHPVMFRLQFPAMLIILGLFRVGIFSAKSGKLSRPFGALLLVSYLGYLTITALQAAS